MPSGGPKKVIIVGCGFLGKAAALLFASRGWEVVGIARHPVVFEKNGYEKNISFFCCDITDSVAVKKLARIFHHSRSEEAAKADGTRQARILMQGCMGTYCPNDNRSLTQYPSDFPASAVEEDEISGLAAKIFHPSLMIYAVSSGKGGAEAYNSIYCEGLQKTIEAWHPQKTVFVSSTSVYGQSDGEVVNESSLTMPTSATSQLLLKAESIVLNTGGIIARFAGIYGPGRSLLLQKFLAEQAILEEGGHRWINQIHRDDGAEALWVLGTSLKAAGIYIVSDDTPMTQRDLYTMMASYYHKPLPLEGPRDLNRKRGWTSKRLSNAHLKALGWQPAFPSYRDFLISNFKKK